LFLGNLCQQAYSMVDSIIVGKGISDGALAAVGATGVINFLLLGFIFGMTGGFGIHMSQSFGAGDYPKLRKQISVAVILTLAIGLISTVLCLSIIEPLFRFIKTPEDILGDALDYFRIILYGISVSLLCNLAFTILRSVGNSKTPLAATVLSSILNIVLDYIFVIRMKMGVKGAAWATVISQLAAGLVCLYTIMSVDILRIKPDALGFDSHHARQLLGSGMPVAFMNAITAGGCLILQTIVNRMGSNYVASYSACMKINNLLEQVGMSVGITLLTFVGQNIGAGRIQRVKQGVRQGLVLSTVLTVPLAAICILFSEQLVSIMLSDEVTIGYSPEFLPITGIGMFALGYLFCFRYSLQGLGNTILPMCSGLVEVAMRFLFGLTVGRLSYAGIAISEVAAWVGAWLFLMVSFLWVYRKKCYELSGMKTADR